MKKDDAFIELKGKRVQRMTTKGWKLRVQWKDGYPNWECLNDLKESNPVQVAEFAVANSMDAEPAFAWWLPFSLKERTIIIAKLKT
jgi:hypothetical protein